MRSTCCYLHFLHWCKARCIAHMLSHASGFEWQPHMELFIALGDVSSSILMPIICRWFASFVRNVNLKPFFSLLSTRLRFSPILMHVCAVTFSHFLTTCIGMTQSSWHMNNLFLYEYILKEVVLHVSSEMEQVFERKKNWCRWKSKYVKVLLLLLLHFYGLYSNTA